MNFHWQKLQTMVGAQITPISAREKAISVAGGFTGVLVVMVVSHALLGESGAIWMVASMAASAVLLFAVPHGQLSQPWPMVGGHLVSAVAGVTCAQVPLPPVLDGAIAVGSALGAMFYLRCLHPPGGATALTAVLGGAQVHALGYGFVLVPVLVNVVTLLVTALVINFLFGLRRYPVALVHELPGEVPVAGAPVGHDDLIWALRQIDSYVDLPEQELARIVELAEAHAHKRQGDRSEIAVDGYYSNGNLASWQVRKVIHRSSGAEEGDDRVLYRVVAGEGRGEIAGCSGKEFAHWARYRLVRNEGFWRRGEGPLSGFSKERERPR